MWTFGTGKLYCLCSHPILFKIVLDVEGVLILLILKIKKTKWRLQCSVRRPFAVYFDQKLCTVIDHSLFLL